MEKKFDILKFDRKVVSLYWFWFVIVGWWERVSPLKL